MDATGVTDSLAPRNQLERIRLRPVGTMTYELADGTEKQYAFGLMRIEFLDKLAAGREIVGEPGIELILGVTVDPANQTVKRIPAIPLE